jgi:hypothetical protein
MLCSEVRGNRQGNVGKRLNWVQTEACAGVLEAISHHQLAAWDKHLTYLRVIVQESRGGFVADFRCDEKNRMHCIGHSSEGLRNTRHVVPSIARPDAEGLFDASHHHETTTATFVNQALSLLLPISRGISPFSAISFKTFSAVFIASTPAGTPQ